MCPRAGIIIGGDKNDLNISPLLNAVPGLRQIVDKPTYKDKILDVIITNLWQFYRPVEIVPAVPCDDPLSGKPSDHLTAVSRPLTSNDNPPNRVYKTKSCRPIPESGVRGFFEWITVEKWDALSQNISPSKQVLIF